MGNLQHEWAVVFTIGVIDGSAYTSRFDEHRLKLFKARFAMG
jgi:hypothetical protein